MRFLIAGGGTGGHVFPGVALAEALRRQNPKNEVLFVGTQRGIESREVPKAGFELKTLEISGLKGKSLEVRLKVLIDLPWAIVQAFNIIREFGPQVVIGVGGYASGPVLLAAWFLRVPRGICEQNSVPGLTNRILGKYFVKHIWGAFKFSKKYFLNRNYIVTGVPLRESFKEAENNKNIKNLDKNLVLVLGGSRGARFLNQILPKILANINKKIDNLKIIHQAGKDDLDLVKESYDSLGFKLGEGEQLEVLEFIEDMPSVYNKASLVVARAGATTCAELTALGVPSILVPFPFAADDHQTENAMELVKAGAALRVSQEKATENRLSGMIQHLLMDLKNLENMAYKAKQLGRINAADTVAKRVLELC